VAAAPELLGRYRALVTAEVERRLPTLEPFRWLYGPLADYPRRSGKGFRGALCLAACEAFGGAAEDALPAAAGLELLHSACLVHDDIEDGSDLRRGRPALHVLEGLPLALNAGDALALLGLGAVRRTNGRLGRRLAAAVEHELTTAAWHTLEGQAVELGWRRDGVVDVTVEDYLSLVLHKTCWYTTIAPLRVGALIGARGREVPLSALTRLGFCLGVAFQVTDDVLNAGPAVSEYDKDARADLREGKRTLLLVHLLSVATPADRELLMAWLRPGQELDSEDVDRLAAMFCEYGSADVARAFARGAADAAADAIPAVFGEVSRGAPAAVVAYLVDHVVSRSH
jgi:geranylgeranyl diphosphate synthase type II